MEENKGFNLGLFSTPSGAIKPIEWVVLKEDKDSCYVISRKIISSYVYSTNEQWKDSRLRLWLNNDFYNSVFSDAEKNVIIEMPNFDDTLIILDEYDEYGGAVMSSFNGLKPLSRPSISRERISIPKFKDLFTTHYNCNPPEHLAKVSNSNSVPSKEDSYSASFFLMDLCMSTYHGKTRDSFPHVMPRNIVFGEYCFSWEDTLNFGDLSGVRPCMWVNKHKLHELLNI